MVLASSSTEGTGAAVEYATEAAHARDMVSRLRQSSGELPKSYQVVIKAKFKESVHERRVSFDTFLEIHG